MHSESRSVKAQSIRSAPVGTLHIATSSRRPASSSREPVAHFPNIPQTPSLSQILLVVPASSPVMAFVFDSVRQHVMCPCFICHRHSIAIRLPAVIGGVPFLNLSCFALLFSQKNTSSRDALRRGHISCLIKALDSFAAVLRQLTDVFNHNKHVLRILIQIYHHR